MKFPRFTLRGFQRPRELILSALGKLERAVMEDVWLRDETSVRDVFKAFDERVAYTTLMTTLDRLYKKGLLHRRKDGRAFLYSPKVTREGLERGITVDVIEELITNTVEVRPILSCIVDSVSERDGELLDELERLVKEKRKELEKENK
jgi:predicted transcriptional regulator